MIPHANNPRILSQKNHTELKNSFKKFDYAELVAINTDNTILAGHQRIAIMKELGWDEKEIEVRVPSSHLSDEIAKEYLIRSNKNTGEWDFDILANEWDMDKLFEWGFEKADFDVDDWESNIDDAVDETEDDALTETVKITCSQGLKDSIIKLIKPILHDLDVTIT